MSREGLERSHGGLHSGYHGAGGSLGARGLGQGGNQFKIFYLTPDRKTLPLHEELGGGRFSNRL